MIVEKTLRFIGQSKKILQTHPILLKKHCRKDDRKLKGTMSVYDSVELERSVLEMKNITYPVSCFFCVGVVMVD